MNHLRDAAMADLAGLSARHPHVMRPAWARRATTGLLVTALLLAFVGALASLDVSWVRFFGGFRELGRQDRLQCRRSRDRQHSHAAGPRS